MTGLAGAGSSCRTTGRQPPALVERNLHLPTSIASDGTYLVTVSATPGSPTQTCVVSNGSGTVTNANITNVAVTCATNSTPLAAR